jgi:hypothetical protein
VEWPNRELDAWGSLGFGVCMSLVGGALPMVFPSEYQRWIGTFLIVIGVGIGILSVVRLFLLRAPFRFEDGSEVRRFTWREFCRLSEHERRRLKQRNPESYRQIEEETNYRMGPPGRPHDPWDDESRVQYLLRVGPLGCTWHLIWSLAITVGKFIRSSR